MTRNVALGKPKAPKSEKAYNILKAAVLTGDSPGKVLQETVLTEKFGLSRTPFREACNRLQNEQLLEVLPRHGYYIPELSLRVVRDLFRSAGYCSRPQLPKQRRLEPGQMKLKNSQSSKKPYAHSLQSPQLTS